MKASLWRVGLATMLAGGLGVSVVCAEEGSKVLPTLLIKGEVVSLDTTDPNATLLKVKDRYGFETPIFLTSETKLTQGEATIQAASLTASSKVEVEYNFDVNTAKRHAVSVKLAAALAAEAAAPAAPSAPGPTASMPAATPAPAMPQQPQAAPEAPAPAGDSAPATQ